MLRIALTSGEPAGIGPDLCVMLAQQARQAELVVFADETVLKARAEQLNLPLTLRPFDPTMQAQSDPPGTLCVYAIPTNKPVKAGQLDAANAAYVLQLLDAATKACMDKTVAAMVTAPVHKGIINDAGISFSGHTEYLANLTGGHPVMVLATGTFRVALATTHLPLSAVASAITEGTLTHVLNVLSNDLKKHYAIEKPHILVCGLNPHAGEDGHLGMEEIDVIIPTLNKLRKTGLHLTGPLPADTLFTPHHLSDADAVLAMFHDQGLPVLKYAGFGKAVNVTFGLPIIRTSVDHGTALDKAGTASIDDGSLTHAISMAIDMANNTH